MTLLHPLISCICITSNRPILLQRALSCFETQDYLNRELVISYPENDQSTKALLDQITRISDIRIIKIERPETEKLGSARNNAVKAASGAFICVWDDDDWYSNNRISYQYEVIRGSPFKASICTCMVLLSSTNQKSCISDFRLWEGSLLCEREILLKQPYLDQEQSEADTILHELSTSGRLFPIIDEPYLYVYILHGNNVYQERDLNLHFYNNYPLEEAVRENIMELTSLENYVL